MSKTKIILSRKKSLLHWVRGFRVFIDGEQRGNVGNGQLEEFEVSPGTHKVVCKIGLYSSNEYEVNVSEGSTERLEVKIGMKGFLPIYLFFLAVVIYQLYLRYTKTPVPAYFETVRLAAIILIFAYFIYYLTLGRKKYLVISKDISGFFTK